MSRYYDELLRCGVKKLDKNDKNVSFFQQSFDNEKIAILEHSWEFLSKGKSLVNFIVLWQNVFMKKF